MSHAADPYWGQLVPAALGAVAGRLAGARGVDGDCGRCGLTCCAFDIEAGPREAGALEDAARLAGVPAEALWAGPAGSPSGVRRLAERPDGACVLLDPGGRCRVHAAAGLARKPAACQLFPAAPRLTPSGPRVAARPGCPWPTRDADAAPWEALVGRLAALRPEVTVASAPETVRVTAGGWLPWAAWEAWEARAARHLAEAPSARAGLAAAARDMLAEVGEALPAPDPAALSREADGLSFLAAAVRGQDALQALVAVALGAPPPSPRPCPRDKVADALQALYPLRFGLAADGLGALSLAVEAIDRHPRRPAAEAAADVFRALADARVHAALAGGPPGRLAALLAPA